MFTIVNIKETTTVMDEIKKYNSNTILITEKQTNGRGKNNRIWISEKSNNLYMAIKILANNDKINYSNYCFLSAVTMLESIKSIFSDINLKLKWPNDILLNNKKICGILLERDIQEKTLIIGIGLNIDNSPQLNSDILFPATNLKKEGFVIIDKNELLNYFIKYFEINSNYINKNNFEIIKQKWIDNAYNFKKEIIAKTSFVEYKGIFENMDNDGTLILNCNSNIIKINSADIF